MKKLLTLAAIFALVLAGCDADAGNGGNGAASKTTLSIENVSDYDIFDVGYGSVDLGSINRGKNSTKEVEAGTRYIFFSIKVNNDLITCRTEAVTCEEGKKTNFNITNNSSVTVTASDKRDTLRNIFNTLSSIPGNLRVTSVTENSISLIWNAVNEATGYNIYRSTSQNGTYNINFSPATVQDYNATVTINSNDRDGDFIFTIRAQGVAPKPIASVFYADSEVAQNGTINVGEVLITLSKSITVVIKNTGVEVLALETADITITGADAGAFTKTTNPDSNVSVGGQTQFIIGFEPTKEGENNAVLTIPTNDNSRNPVTVFLRATAIKGSGILELSQDNTVIASNYITPFDFGRTVLGGSASLVFTITNNGNIPLILTGTPAVSSSSGVFTVTTQPANTTINPATTVQFIIQYTPILEQEDTGAITITNDSNDTLFVLNVKGTGYVKRPQISVFYGNTEIPQYGTINAGDVEINQSKDITVIIRNTGEELLTVDQGNITISDEDADVFTRVTNPAANVSAGGQTQFVIRCTPDAEGEYQATLTIPTNDSFRTPYIIYLQANAHSQNAVNLNKAIQEVADYLDTRRPYIRL